MEYVRIFIILLYIYISLIMKKNKENESLIKNRLWNGKEFYSRNGRALASIPKSFKEDLPDIFLDGELWYSLLYLSLSFYLLCLRMHL